MFRASLAVLVLGSILSPAAGAQVRTARTVRPAAFVRHDEGGASLVSYFVRRGDSLVPVSSGPAALGPSLGGSAGRSGPQLTYPPAPVSGAQPFAVLGCRFSGVASEPITPATMQTMIGETYPGLGDYFREVSNDLVNLTGSIVYGWATLPQDPSYYAPGGTSDPVRLYTDCMAVHDASVDFLRFQGVLMIFNAPLPGTGYFGAFSSQDVVPITIDGATRSYRLAFIGSSSAAKQFVWAHSVGHTFDLLHSSGAPPYTTNSFWDMMAKGGFVDGGYPSRIAVHLKAVDKHLLGWIPPARAYTAATGSNLVLQLERSARPAANTDYLIAKVPIAGAAGAYYTAEVRKVAGYDRLGDSAMAGEGVVVHRVTPTRSDPLAEVMDSDGNGNPNDAGGFLIPGESFTDAVNRVKIAVLSATGTGYTVQVCLAAGGVGVYGDVNGDGQVNVIDAQLVSRYSVGLSVPDIGRTQVNGDVNQDGAANVIDAQLIARHSVGLATPGASIGQPVGSLC